MYNIEMIEKFFLSKESMSPKKLQKLLYYAYAWTLVFKNKDVDHITIKLFEDQIQAWAHGPMIPNVYFKYCDRRMDIIPMLSDADLSQIDSETLDILHQVWKLYGKYTDNQLEEMSCREDPWKLARDENFVLETRANIISDEQIFVYYNDL